MKNASLSANPQAVGSQTDAGGRDFVSLGIVVAGIITFLGTGGSVMPQIVRQILHLDAGPQSWLISAMLLNIALILFSWRRYAGLRREVDTLRHSEGEARRLAETDPLTGCLNRRSLLPATERLLDEGASHGTVVAVVMIDLDNFKDINDRNGHASGDIVLQQAARRIAALLPERAALGRLGGDEFACALAVEAGHLDRVDQLAGQIAEAIGEGIDALGSRIEVTVSIGLAHSACLREGAMNGRLDSQTLYHMADIAMYHAKSQGRNNHAWFDPALESELRLRKELEASIRRGIARGEFVPYYEQQIDLNTGELTGFEMLARWNSPAKGLINPEFFIPIAERMGVIGDLSESVIAQALQDAKAWDPQLTLSVNISPVQLRDPWFAQKLLKLLVEANFPAHRLEIEITESCIHENIGMVCTLVTSLKNQGIRTSLDDFGTGYSSIAQLRNLPFDRIKIDKTIVANIDHSRENASIMEAITKLGEGLGLPITAEGIESEAVLDALRGYGPFRGQGYYYGRPQPAAETLEQLAQMGLAAVSDNAEPAKPEMRGAAKG
ncbi:MAG TPA: EAL domain-containing protein [Novosphingobium sp.]